MPNCKRPLAATFLLLGLAAGLAVAQVPPIPNIHEDLLEGQLLTTHKRQINTRIDWWKQKLLLAGSTDDILRARQSLLGDYSLYNSPAYKRYFAGRAARVFAPLLTGQGYQPDDNLAALRKINTAMVLAEMHQATIQPALEIMVASDNQALRLFGWEGYMNTQPALLKASAGPKALTSLVNALRNALETETNPLILSRVFRTMDIPASSPLPAATKQRAQIQFVQAFQRAWPAQRRAVLDGAGPKHLAAVTQAIPLLGNLAANLQQAANAADGQARKDLASAATAAVQMLAEMTDSAANAFDKAWQNRDDQQERLASLETLLRACETALQTATGLKHNHLAGKLDAPLAEVGDRAAAILKAYLQWLEALKTRGVKQPASPPKKD